MIIMKKLISVIMLAVFLLSLSSCGGRGAAEEKTPIIPPGGVSVNRPDTKIMYTDHFTVSDKMISYSLSEHYYAFCERLAESGLTAADLGIAEGTSLKDQSCLADASVKTWLEYFANQVEYSFMEQLVLCEAAFEAGISLDDADRAAVDSRIEELMLEARRNGKTDTAYIAELYGSEVGVGDIRDALELSHLAEKYLRSAADSADTSEEALERFYADHSDAIDSADILVYVFSSEESAYAEQLAAQKTPEDFLAYIHHHVTSVRGLSESDYEEIRDGHVVRENVRMDKDDPTVSFAFSARTGDVSITTDKSGASTVVFVTRSGSRNEKPDENGTPFWIAETKAMIEAELVESATAEAAKRYSVTVDRQKLYGIDIKG